MQSYIKSSLFLLLAFLFSCSSWHKYDTEQYGKERVISFKEHKAEFEVSFKTPKVKDNRVIYTWFAGDRIKQTQGGYSGYLLDGLYTETYSNKNLKSQGMFKQGVKVGDWKSWDKEGMLIETQTYKKGILESKVIFEKGLPADTIEYITKKDKKDKG